MTEPVTSARTLVVPNTGDLSGAWGTAALNNNFQIIDALVGGTTTISLTSATTIFLSVPSTTGAPGSPSQSSQALIYFTGAQTGNSIIGVSLPGYYIVHNQCTGTSYVQLAPSASGSLTGGNRIGAPPGKKCHVFFDGTNMDYVNMPDPGTAYDFHTNTTTLPPWMVACTVAPYLLKDGSTYSTATYPALSQYLGSTFGGNGVTTFGVPDERNRMRIPVATGVDPSRVTQAISGVNGTTFGSSGGDQRMNQHNHGITDPGHSHTVGPTVPSAGATLFAGSGFATSSPNTGTSVTNITINNAGTGSSQNMPPTIVSFLALIKT